MALNRYAINAVAWFGKDFSAFGGEVVGDDEEFLTVIHPSKINRIHCFDCNTIAVHFSFSSLPKTTSASAHAFAVQGQ